MSKTKTRTPADVTINQDQQLYVIPAGNGGFTCLGFDVAIKWTRDIAGWLQECDRISFELLQALHKMDDLRGTLKAYNLYRDIVAIAQELHRDTGRRCEAHLTPQLIDYEGQRVEVIDRDGQNRRFWVGKSTGWLPVHLEISRRDSTGGPAVYGAPFRSVRVDHASPVKLFPEFREKNADRC